MMKYWITIDKSTLGPLTADEIKAQFLDKISSTTPCAKIDSSEWSTAGALFPEFNLAVIKPSPADILPENKAPGPKLDSIYHKLANAAIYSLLSVFFLDVFFEGVAREASRNGIQWPFYIKTILGMLLIASSFACGLISLFGIRRYGKRKLLWKGLVCTILPAVAMAGAVMAFHSAKAVKARHIHEQQAK